MARRVKDKSNRARFQRLVRNPSMDPKIHRATITVSGSFNAAAGGTGATVTMADIRGATDYTNFSALYKTHRVVGLEVELFDLQPGSPIAAMCGTMHTGGSVGSATLALVQDLPDSANIIPYRSHYLHWIANTPAEKLFYDSGLTATLNDFGGLFFWSLGGSVVTTKWRYLVRAVVEFKDRV